jgi:farnesyl diphosphate synthase
VTAFSPDPRWQGWRRRVEAALDACLPAPDQEPARLHEAMRYACLGGGKRLRALLVYSSGVLVEAPPEALDGPACAVELVHAYSLVHDDLPAMDDDDLRRGKPTCHRAYGEATALLAGDALQTLAFESLAGNDALAAARRADMVAALARASGSRGMAGGQAIDLDAVGRHLSLDQLERMHRLKTGALIRASIQLGAMAGNEVNDGTAAALDAFGHAVGLAFQVVDDILDETADTEVLGKTSGADRSLDKPTYPALLGVAGARFRADGLIREACERLAGLDGDTSSLLALAQYVVRRVN